MCFKQKNKKKQFQTTIRTYLVKFKKNIFFERGMFLLFFFFFFKNNIFHKNKFMKQKLKRKNNTKLPLIILKKKGKKQKSPYATSPSIGQWNFLYCWRWRSLEIWTTKNKPYLLILARQCPRTLSLSPKSYVIWYYYLLKLEMTMIEIEFKVAVLSLELFDNI